MVSTASGLTLAIPVMLVFQYLSSRVDGLIDHIDEVGTGFIVNHARLESPQVVETTGLGLGRQPRARIGPSS